jgi:hypothetical protein
MQRVSDVMNIPKRTLHDWKLTDWWIEQSAQVRAQKSDELDSNFTRLIDTAFEQAGDRLVNGDTRLFKDQLIRVPMSGRDCVIAGATLYDKQRLHRNQPTSITDKRDSLASMAKKFEELADRYIARDKTIVSEQ